MERFHRFLSIDLPPRQSAFLWGARKIGKSTYLKNRFPKSVIFDLLDTGLFLELSKTPSLLRQRLAAIGKKSLRSPIILCGSSARKLRRGHANLLGGRAWRMPS